MMVEMLHPYTVPLIIACHLRELELTLRQYSIKTNCLIEDFSSRGEGSLFFTLLSRFRVPSIKIFVFFSRGPQMDRLKRRKIKSEIKKHRDKQIQREGHH